MREHTTHHDDCGCLTARYEARVATLEAELAASREDAKLAWAEAAMGPTEAAITHELAKLQAHANALRDALEKIRGCMGWDYGKGMDAPEDVLEIAITALEATPAASLAAHDAEVWEKAWKCGHEAAFTKHDAEVLERAAKVCFGVQPHGGHCSCQACWYPRVCANGIRALAAQEVPRA